MTWTLDKPQKPGFYWHRNTKKAWVVEVLEAQGRLITDYGIPVEHDTGEWAGPIEPPQ